MRNDIVENVVETVVVPDVPKVLPDQEIYVYVPVATENDKGILSAGGPDFAIVDGKLKLLDGPNSKLYGINAFINLVNEKVKRLEDAGYITNDVDSLVNYYLKSETYTRDEVNAAIQRTQKAAFKIVNELPEVGDFNLVYLLPKKDSDTGDLYDEYVYIDGKWERIGSTAINFVGKSVFVRYSASADGRSMTETWQRGQKYLGTLVAETASDDYTAYDWSLFVGDAFCSEDGTSGIATVTLADETDQTLTGALTKLSVTIPNTVAHGFYAGLNFKSGETPPDVVFTNGSGLPLKIIMRGALVENYTPQPNKTVQMLAYSDGINLYVYANEV